MWFRSDSDILSLINSEKGDHLPIRTFTASVWLLLAIAGPAHAARPIPVDRGEYRLGDSPQTPEDGLAWLTVDTDSPDWQPFLTSEGHPAGEFTNAWRRFRLPDIPLADPTLYLAGWPPFEAYIDTQMVYRAGALFPEARNKFSNHTWHLIPLPADFPGKPIYFRTFSEHAGAYVEPTRISVASRSDHMIDMVRRELAQATVGLFLVLIGVGALFVYAGRSFKPALSLAFFSVSVGVFSTLHTDIASMLIPQGYLLWYLTHIPLYTFPIGLWMFLDDITDGNCPITRRLWQLHVVYAVGALIADAAGWYPMFVTAPYTILLLAGIAIAGVVIGQHLYRKRSDPDADVTEGRILGAGFALLALSGAYDLLGQFRLVPHAGPVFHFGVLFFVIALAVILERRFSLAHDQLRAYSRDLERRVSERTRDLDDKNRALEQAMTDLRETQRQLVLREKMAALGDLVAGVAHEVNTPIGAVNSSADVADRCIDKLSDLVDTTPDTNQLKSQKSWQQAMTLLRENTGLIRNAGDRIARIVRSLRSFARLDEADFQTVDIHEGIDSTLDLVSHQLRGRIEVIRDYGDAVPEVDCYPNQLNQVFMNVLVNAAQAIDDAGTITIRTRSDGETVTVAIRDTGRGIPADILDRIFDPGFTTKGVGVGTGLGLSISYQIVEDHGGRIEVDSRPGEGTDFRIVLPVRRPAPEPA